MCGSRAGAAHEGADEGGLASGGADAELVSISRSRPHGHRTGVHRGVVGTHEVVCEDGGDAGRAGRAAVQVVCPGVEVQVADGFTGLGFLIRTNAKSSDYSFTAPIAIGGIQSDGSGVENFSTRPTGGAIVVNQEAPASVHGDGACIAQVAVERELEQTSINGDGAGKPCAGNAADVHIGSS